MNIMNLGIIQETVNTKEINREQRYSNEEKNRVLETLELK